MHFLTLLHVGTMRSNCRSGLPDEHILYEMPVRVFCTVPDAGLSFSDYMLQDEEPDDALERFRDISGLRDISLDDLETEVERVPSMPFSLGVSKIIIMLIVKGYQISNILIA